MNRKIIFATMIWDANGASKSFSSMYNEEWIEKLYRGFERNTTYDFEFHLWTDRDRDVGVPVVQHRIKADPPTYAAYIEPFALGAPMILVGLDTVITGNVDPLVNYCFSDNPVALPLDPYRPSRVCNGVALIPAGCAYIYDRHDGHRNDMEHLRDMPHLHIDSLFPGLVRSYKCHVKGADLTDERIVYFHGLEKPHELDGVEWIGEHWR